MENVKPPLGLKPKKIFEVEMARIRRTDVLEAIERYIDAEMDVPEEWIREYNQLNKIINGDDANGLHKRNGFR